VHFHGQTQYVPRGLRQSVLGENSKSEARNPNEGFALEIRNPKLEIRNKSKIRNEEIRNEDAMEEGSKEYDLEERTYQFARRVRAFVKRLPRTICNIEDVKQVVRSSGSVGANYIEANESLGKKDFQMHIKISRKESKESRYWLRLIDIGDDNDLSRERDELVQESTELMKIFASILRKSE
jgi:four helix bundle protein